MASLVIRNLDAEFKERLRVRAARNGRSMEAEARLILVAAVDEDAAGGLIGTLRSRLRDVGGYEGVPLPERTQQQRPVPFG